MLDAATLAHDLRSPLSALKLTTSSLPLPADADQLIRQSLEMLEAMIAKIPALGIPKTENRKAISSPYSLIQKLLPIFKQSADAKNIGLRFFIDQKTQSTFASIEETELQRVIINLVNNALEAMDESEKYQLLTLRLYVSKGFLKLTVEDNGKGIPADRIPLLTNAGATFGKTKGQGLGLYQARKAIEQAGGKLLIQSCLGQGTSVTILLPLPSRPATHALRPSLSLCA